MNDQDDYLGPEWLIAIGIIALLCLLLTGCSATPRPNDPSETSASQSETFKPDGTHTRTETFSHRGPQNETRSATVAWGALKIGSASADAADLSAVTGEPLFWIGGVTIILGVGLLVASKYPGLNLTIPAGAGFWFIGAGVLIALLPFIGQEVAKLVIPIGLLGGAVALAWYANKAGWFVNMTSPKAQMERIKKGDPETAAAMAFLNTGGDKDKAKAVKAAKVKP
jgi:hypothetical protein